jgi:hypothetical protein
MPKLFDKSDDINGLIQAMRRFAYENQDEEVRRKVLTNAGIKPLYTLNFNANTADFADKLVEILNRMPAANEKPELIKLFEYFLTNDPKNYGLDDEDEALFNRLIPVWGQPPPQEVEPKPPVGPTPPGPLPQGPLTSLSLTRRYLIDGDVLVKYDLTLLEEQFKKPLVEARTLRFRDRRRSHDSPKSCGRTGQKLAH